MKRFISLFIAVPAAAGVIAAATGGAAGAAGGSLPKLTISTNGQSISVGGALQSGAVDVVTKAAKEGQANPILIRLNAGVTPQRLISFLHSKAANDANNVSRYGSIVFDVGAPKGTSSVQTKLDPAEYVAVDASRGPSKAPTTSFTVNQAAQPASLPKPDATLKAIDFGFKGPATVHDGDLVRFANRGFVAHMNIALPAANAADAKKLVRALHTGNDKAARGLVSGQPLTWMGTVSHGAVQQAKLDAKPGFYVMACFEDTQDGREHTLLGMERAIRVVK